MSNYRTLKEIEDSYILSYPIDYLLIYEICGFYYSLPSDGYSMPVEHEKIGSDIINHVFTGVVRPTYFPVVLTFHEKYGDQEEYLKGYSVDEVEVCYDLFQENNLDKKFQKKSSYTMLDKIHLENRIALLTELVELLGNEVIEFINNPSHKTLLIPRKDKPYKLNIAKLEEMLNKHLFDLKRNIHGRGEKGVKSFIEEIKHIFKK